MREGEGEEKGGQSDREMRRGEDERESACARVRALYSKAVKRLQTTLDETTPLRAHT
jgi:hypothetical protein